MKTFQLFPSIIASAFVLAPTLSAQTIYDSTSVVPVAGSWSSPFAGVTLDFGLNRGLGTVTVASINGGTYTAGSISPYNPVPPRTTTMDNGDVVSLTDRVSFAPGNSGVSGLGPGDSGISFTYTLNSGQFKAGDILAIGSLDYTSPGTVGSNFGQVDGNFGPLQINQVRADNSVFNPIAAIAGTSGLANGTAYTPYGGTQPGYNVGNWGFFRLTQDTKSFTTYITSTGNAQGVALSFAVPVPEPSVGFLGLAGLGSVILRRKR